MFPIVVLAALALATVPKQHATLRAGVIVYVAITLGVYAVASPIGSNIARLGTFLAAPLAALLWWRKRTALLLIAALPLLYLEWAAPVRDLSSAAGDQSTSTDYYQPLLAFLRHDPPRPPRRFASRSRSRAFTGRPTWSPPTSRSRAGGSASSTSPTTRSSTAAA